MKITRHPALPIVLVLLSGAPLTAASAQTRVAEQNRDPIPQGQRLDAHDGDLIVIEDNARVRIVRRERAIVRTIYNATDRWLVLLIDRYGRGQPPDGGVDVSYTFNDVRGDWPLSERWQGEAIVDYYSTADRIRPQQGIGLHSPQGLIQFLNPPDDPLFRDPTSISVISSRGGGSGSGGNQSFDETERQQVANAMRNAANQARVPAGATMYSSLDVIGGGMAVSSAARSDGAPLRVGGNIQMPRKIVDAPPIYPATALKAGIIGTVILEVTIGPDGAVSGARILRSIPLLDDAAIETVRKWRYEPTLLNGNPVSVVMTVPLTFTQ
jgi:TonB family protein